MNKIIPINNIQSCIHTIRNTQVMLDRDLAKFYGVSIKRLNEQVKRNIKRFPNRFMFKLTKNEWETIGSQIATLKKGKGQHRKYLPYAFTEQGISMLSAVLKSDTAIEISIKIIDSFVKMRKFLSLNAQVFTRLEKLEDWKMISDKNFEKLFLALEKNILKPKQGIFYNGQIFDAHVFISDIIKSAKKSIILIDNFIDETVFQLFTKRKKGIEVVFYTKKITKTLELDLKKFNSQHEKIFLKKFRDSHDRFLLIDHKKLYHTGASLKDLGKKWFAFSRMDSMVKDVLVKLKSQTT